MINVFISLMINDRRRLTFTVADQFLVVVNNTVLSTVEYFDKQTSALHAIAGQNHLFGCFNTFFHYKPKKKKNCKNTQKKGSTRVGAC